MKETHVYRYFGPLLRRQETWLNQMARRGWRLARAGRLRYDFTPCQAGAYEYRVEFVGHLSYAKARDYRGFLEELGYRVLTKNINLNWSWGKVRWRPYGKGRGQWATSPGGYNKELLLVEKEADGRAFQLHTTHADLARYCKTLRNLWLTPALLCWAFALWLACRGGIPGAVLLSLLGLVCWFPALAWAKQSRAARRDAALRDS